MTPSEETGAPAPAAEAPAASDAPAAPPETKAPEPETRSPFVVTSPLMGGAAIVADRGAVVALTAAQAAEWASLVRAADPIDLSRWAKSPIVL